MRDSSLFASKNPFSTPRQNSPAATRAIDTPGSAAGAKSVRFSPSQAVCGSGASALSAAGGGGGAGGAAAAGQQTLFQPQASYSTSPPSRLSYNLTRTPLGGASNAGQQTSGGLTSTGSAVPSAKLVSTSNQPSFSTNPRTKVTLPIRVVEDVVKSPQEKHKVLLGRGEVATRLRLNSVLLVGFWISSRTNLYGYASGHLVQIIPSLDTPLHFLESSVLLLLFYNICDSLYRLNQLSSLPPPISTSVNSQRSPTRPSPSSVQIPSPGPRTPTTSTSSPFGTPTLRSSPKTRPSPTSAAPISPLRPNVSPSPQSQTPSNSTPYNLRKSLLNYNTGNISPSALGVVGVVGGGEETGLLNAYLARHSPMSSKLNKSMNSREAIDRLLED